jgi:peptidoglycan/LPS O-acetylase OafA/YrhL
MVPIAGEKDTGRLDVLDGLRGIAMLLVLWFHVWQKGWVRADIPLFGHTLNFNWIAETGFIGVDLFFFVSGFCLFYPYARTLFDGRRLQTTAEYAWHRARKILPSYWVLLAALFAVGFARFDTPAETFRQVATHVAFIHTWFSDTYGTIDGVLWSLGVEVQFYVLFPLLCWAAMRMPWLTFAAMFAVALGYRAGAQALTGDHLGGFISQMPGVLDLFAAGMAAAYAYRWLATKTPALTKKTWLWTLVAPAALSLAALLTMNVYGQRSLPNWSDNWYVWGRTPLALVFFALTISSLFAARWWRATIANPAFVFISVISYNLYLWHVVVAESVRTNPFFVWHDVMPIHATQSEQLHYELTTIALAIAVAVIPTYLIERPLLRLPRPGSKGRPASVSATATGRN